MQFSVAELPLALFTTLAPLGAGAFIALACAFFTTSFSDEQLKRIDRGTIIPLAIVIVGFICAFFHLASPMNAPSVFLGAGSPMSNEIIAGCVFAIVAIVYVVVANAGKLCGSGRKGFAAVVAVLAVLFAIFTGLAYVMSTIATWDTPLVPVQMLGFALVGIYWGGSREIQPLYQAAFNLNMVAMGAGVIQGLSLMSYVMDRFRVGKVMRICLYAFVLLGGVLMQILAFTGLFDMLFDYRRRFGQKKS